MTDKKSTKSTSTNGSSTTSSKGSGFPADRQADTAPKVNEQLAKQENSKEPTFAGPGRPDLGERLAAEAVRKADNQGGVANVKLVDNKAGGMTAVSEPLPADKSDNGKVYKDPRVNPRDTNAPDAGLTPNGVRVAE